MNWLLIKENVNVKPKGINSKMKRKMKVKKLLMFYHTLEKKQIAKAKKGNLTWQKYQELFHSKI